MNSPKVLITEIQLLSDLAVQEYIFDHGADDEKKLLLSHKEMFGFPFRLIANQIAVRKKAEMKLPDFYKSKRIIYPPSINFEQCSSEATAKFKVQIVAKEVGQRKLKIADLTGGFGIDGYFLSAISDSLDFVEPDDNLLNIARHNQSVLGVSHVSYHHSSAEDFLKQNQKHFDLIYLDPSRRNARTQKVFRLADCLPDVTSLGSKLFEKSDFILLKASPLLDIQQGLNELIFTKKVFVVSVANECKELIFLLQKNYSGEIAVETFNLNKGGDIKQSFSFMFPDEKNSASEIGEPQTYLYEPNASVLKSGAFKLIGQKFGLKKLHTNTHLYTSSSFEENFPGKVFKIEQLEFEPRSLLEKKANVITRNFPLKPEVLKRKLKLSDGGENYVIAFSGLKKKYLILAKRLE